MNLESETTVLFLKKRLTGLKENDVFKLFLISTLE